MDLLDRDEEMRWFGAALRRAQAGSGAVVAVEGAAGTGRSAFVQEARSRARAAGAVVLATRAMDGDRDTPHVVIRRLCAPASHHATLGAGAPDGVPDAFVQLVAALATDHPVLIAVDDVERADRESLRALAELVVRLDEVGGVVVLLARRHDYPDAAGAAQLDSIYGDPGTVRIRLRAFDVEGVAQMTADVLGRPPEPDFGTALQRVSGGNPFLLRELLMALAEDQVAPVDDATGRVLAVAPRSVAHAVDDRVASAAGSELVAVLAVLGEEASLAAAAALVGGRYSVVADLAGDLVAADVLSSANPPRFAQPLIEAAVYEAIAPGTRLELHGRAARALAAAGACPHAIARHLLRSAPSGDVWVVNELRDAADRANGFVPAVVPYLERALAEGVGEFEATLSRDVGYALSALGNIRARGYLERAHVLTEDPAERAAIALAIVRDLIARGAADSAARVLDRALAELPPTEAAMRARLEAELAYATGPGAVLPPPGVGAGSAGRLALAHDAAVAVRRGEDPDKIAALARRALDGDLLFEEMGSLVPFLAVEALAAVDLLDEARALWDSTLERAELCGLRRMATAVRGYRARVRLRMGDVDGAIADARTVLDDIGSARGSVRRRAVAALVDALIEAGELDEAVATIDRLRAVGTLRASLGVLVSARVRLALGRPADALVELEKAGPSLAGVSPAVAPWRSLAAHCLVQLGDRERAWSLAAEELELARATRVPTAAARALRALGSLDHHREAERLLAHTPARLDHAHALVALGSSLRVARHRTEARAVLKDGMEAAHRCGARALAAHARDELVAAGARPRRPVDSGVEGLTRSERRVAELAASGHTNREIGEQLFVTMNTVAAHLASVYRKLGISSRAQLPATLAA